jgi:preprotein translocase subunit SecB
MTDTSATPSTAAAPQAAPRSSVPITMVRQYLKDLSFESPNAIETLGTGEGPTGAIHVDVRARAAVDDTYEVSLLLRAEAKLGERSAYLVEIEYAGQISIGEVPPEAIEPLLMVEAPRLLFPFARAILATVSADGGFAPLMIQPIDFAALYRDYRRRRTQATPTGTAIAGSATPAGS